MRRRPIKKHGLPALLRASKLSSMLRPLHRHTTTSQLVPRLLRLRHRVPFSPSRPQRARGQSLRRDTTTPHPRHLHRRAERIRLQPAALCLRTRADSPKRCTCPLAAARETASLSSMTSSRRWSDAVSSATISTLVRRAWTSAGRRLPSVERALTRSRVPFRIFECSQSPLHSSSAFSCTTSLITAFSFSSRYTPPKNTSDTLQNEPFFRARRVIARQS